MKPPVELERPHCHSTSVIFMSGSVSVAVIGSPTAGWVVEKVTEPSSSSFSTMMTRGNELLASSLSVVTIVTWYMLFPSASAGDS